MIRWLLCSVLVFWLVACDGGIYLRDGVTDGDTFYLARRALHDPDPVLQSWVSYSLTRSACQLQIGGENPARNSSFECEFTAREHLLETWAELRDRNPSSGDRYLDELRQIEAAGYLDEYVVHNFVQDSWQIPADLDTAQFRAWQRERLPEHRPETRIIGSWNYASVVNP